MRSRREQLQVSVDELLERDVIAIHEQVTIRTHEGETTTMPDGASALYVGETLLMSASEREPGHGRFENACEYRLDRDSRRIRVVADGTTVATGAAFDMDVGLRVELDGEPFFERNWHEVIPRDLL